MSLFQYVESKILHSLQKDGQTEIYRFGMKEAIQEIWYTQTEYDQIL